MEHMEETSQNISAIYVVDSNGNIRSNDSRKWRKKGVLKYSIGHNKKINASNLFATDGK